MAAKQGTVEKGWNSVAVIRKCADCGAATHSPRSSYCEKHFDQRLKLKVLEDY